MLKIFEFIFSGCWHNWVFQKSVKVIDHRGKYTCDDHTSKCSRCGKVRVQRTY